MFATVSVSVCGKVYPPRSKLPDDLSEGQLAQLKSQGAVSETMPPKTVGMSKDALLAKTQADVTKLGGEKLQLEAELAKLKAKLEALEPKGKNPSK